MDLDAIRAKALKTKSEPTRPRRPVAVERCFDDDEAISLPCSNCGQLPLSFGRRVEGDRDPSSQHQDDHRLSRMANRNEQRGR